MSTEDSISPWPFDTPDATDPPANVGEYSVSEISTALKRMVEDTFGHVRVRGELGRVSRSNGVAIRRRGDVVRSLIDQGVRGQFLRRSNSLIL